MGQNKNKIRCVERGNSCSRELNYSSQYLRLIDRERPHEQLDLERSHWSRWHPSLVTLGQTRWGGLSEEAQCRKLSNTMVLLLSLSQPLRDIGSQYQAGLAVSSLSYLPCSFLPVVSRSMMEISYGKLSRQSVSWNKDATASTDSKPVVDRIFFQGIKTQTRASKPIDYRVLLYRSIRLYFMFSWMFFSTLTSYRMYEFLLIKKVACTNSWF